MSDAARPGSDELRTIVELACRAPSVHNTQPWWWRTRPNGLELLADPTRTLKVSDPTGRNLTISCGAALHHAQIVAGALGWSAALERFPDGVDSTLLARLHLTYCDSSADGADVLLSVRERCTDRRRFTSWPVPDALLYDYARLAGVWGTHAVPVVDPTDRFRVDRLVDRAKDVQARDHLIAQEQEAWVDRGGSDGISSAVLPESAGTSATTTATTTAIGYPSRFSTGLLEDPTSDLESSDGLVLLCGYTDTTPDWLRTGEALSAIWLRATLEGLSVVPLSQVIEVAETRSSLQHEILGGLAVPHLLVRFGWQSLGRRQLAPTARRRVDDVLDVPDVPDVPDAPDAPDAPDRLDRLDGVASAPAFKPTAAM